MAAGNIDISGIQNAVAPTARVLASARRAGINIVYLKMGYRPDLSDLGPPDAPNQVRHLETLGVGRTIKTPDGKEGRVLIRDTWGTDILDSLAPQAADIVMYKHRFSGFYQTELDSVLEKANIKHLIFTGCTTSVWSSRQFGTRLLETITVCCSQIAPASRSVRMHRGVTTTHRFW